MFGSSNRLPFRRSGSDIIIGLFNLSIAIGIGVISGHYMFSAPLEQYWTEKRKQEAAAIAAVTAATQQQQQQQQSSPEVLLPSSLQQQQQPQQSTSQNQDTKVK